MLTRVDWITGCHVLAEDIINNEYPKMPKMLICIVLEQVYGGFHGKDESGNLGYHLSYVPKTISKS